MLYADRVRETTTSTGTGNLTLAGAATGFISFDSVFGHAGSAANFEYVISSSGGSEWEVGTGHLTASTTFVRDTVLASSNSGSAVNFSSGTKDVRATLSAHAIATTLTPGRLLSVQVLTSGTTYTRPTGVASILVKGQAAGGGGGGTATASSNNASASSGGGSGGYFEKWYAVAPASGTYAIGAAGTAGSTGGAGGDGGDTTFTDGTTLCTAKGGKGGPVGASNTASNVISIGGSGGAVSTNGDLNRGGEPGQGSFTNGSGASGRNVSGAGGGPGGGIGRTTTGAGVAASGAGGGGGGALALTSGTGATGGAGGAGEIVVWEYS